MANADNAGRSKSATRWSVAFIAGAGCAVGRASGVHSRPIASPTIPHPHHRFALTLSAWGVSSYRRDSTEAPRYGANLSLPQLPPPHPPRGKPTARDARHDTRRQPPGGVIRIKNHRLTAVPSISVGDEARGSAVIFVFCAPTQRKPSLAGWLSLR